MTPTPRPWEASSSCDYWTGGALVIRNNEGRVIVVMTRTEHAKDDRDLIVRAVNAHDELVEALKKAKETIHALHGDIAWDIYDQHSPEMKKINEAIRKAEEG